MDGLPHGRNVTGGLRPGLAAGEMVLQTSGVRGVTHRHDMLGVEQYDFTGNYRGFAGWVSGIRLGTPGALLRPRTQVRRNFVCYNWF